MPNAKTPLQVINARISQVAKSGAAFNQYVHDTAVLILEHSKASGDCTASLRLVQAMPASQRRRLLIEWFATYSPIGMNVSTGKVGYHREGAKLYRPFDIDAARLNPWYNTAQAKKE